MYKSEFSRIIESIILDEIIKILIDTIRIFVHFQSLEIFFSAVRKNYFILSIMTSSVRIRLIDVKSSKNKILLYVHVT